MKLHEIREYDPDPSKNTPRQFLLDIVNDLEMVLPGNWQQKNNTINFPLGNDESVEFMFLYKNKPASDKHHKTAGTLTVLNAHSIQMEFYFAKQPMNLASLHDDPEVQKQLANKMKMPPSYFERNPEDLEEVLDIMKKHGADAVSVEQKSIDFSDVDAALDVIREVQARGPDGMYHSVRFDFLFLTQPLTQKSE